MDKLDSAEETEQEESESDENAVRDKLGVVSSVIDRSPESARLLVFGSNDFLADQTLRMAGSADGTSYGNSVLMVANVVDWALEDQSLIGIRSRGNFNRTLPGIDSNKQSFIEYLNYFLSLAGVLLVLLFFRAHTDRRKETQAAWLQISSGGQS